MASHSNRIPGARAMYRSTHTLDGRRRLFVDVATRRDRARAPRPPCVGFVIEQVCEVNVEPNRQGARGPRTATSKSQVVACVARQALEGAPTRSQNAGRGGRIRTCTSLRTEDFKTDTPPRVTAR